MLPYLHSCQHTVSVSTMTREHLPSGFDYFKAGNHFKEQDCNITANDLVSSTPIFPETPWQDGVSLLS